MARKLKGFNVKRLAMDHGEKIAFGVVVVLVLVALVGTNWLPYAGEPEEITAKVKAATEKLAVEQWPQEQRQEYVLDDDRQPQLVVDARLNERILVSPNYMQSQPMFKDKNVRDDPLQEPELQRVVSLRATTAKVFIEQAPEYPETETPLEGEEGQPGASPEEERPDEFLARDRGIPGAVGGLPGDFGGSGFPGMMDMSGYAGSGLSGMSPEMRRRYTSMDAPELMEDYYGGSGAFSEYGLGSGGMALGPTREGKGYPFVSVRGVFEFKDQVRKIGEAIHRGYSDALRSFELIDFQLERQELVASGSWTDWSLVDVEVFRDIVNQAAGLDPDVVQSVVTDSAITCPLPLRLTGRWNKEATHDRLKNFELTDEQIQREMEFNRALLQRFMDSKAQLPQSPVLKRGFSDMVFDQRQVQQGYMGLSSPYDMMSLDEMGGSGRYGMSETSRYGVPSRPGRGNQPLPPGMKSFEMLADEIYKDMKDKDPAVAAGSPDAQAKLKEWIKGRAVPEGELLLFRYLDFNVEPGKTYRYRVRLELRNPNYGQPLAAAGGLPHVVEGETRFTPWSEETTPVRVEETTKYFLTRVENPTRTRMYPDAVMNMFQYDVDLGTTVQQSLRVALGQNIGGRTRAMTADPAKGTFEEADYTFRSDDMLVDALPDLSFSSSVHPDLKLPVDSRSVARIAPYAIVVDDDGHLHAYDPVAQSADLARQQQLQTWQDEQFASLQARTYGLADTGNIPEEYLELLELEMMSGQELGSGGGRRGRNSLRRGGTPRRKNPVPQPN